MGFLSKFEGKMEDTVEGVASSLGGSSLSPVQITKKAEKQMRREKIVGAGAQYAPTLYTVLVSEEDDAKLFGYYPTLAGEVETVLMAKARQAGLVMDGQPLVRFLADPELKRGKFDIVAEMVSAPIISKLRAEEMQRYGIDSAPGMGAGMGAPGRMSGAGMRPAAGGHRPNVYPQVGAGAAQNAVFQPLQPGAPANMGGFGEYGNDDAADDAYFDEIDEAPHDPFAPQGNAAFAAGAGVGAGAGAASNTAPSEEGPLEVYLYDEGRDVAYQLEARPQRIGRESSNDVVVPDINVSRTHAEIRREPNGTWVVADLGSTNGLFVNGRKVQTAPLRDGDMILIGTTQLEFQLLS